MSNKINKKRSNFIRHVLVPYIRNIKPQYKYLYDDLTAKFLNSEIRNESQIERLIKQLVKRPSAVIKNLDKPKPQPKIKAKPIEVVKKFHLTASIVVRTIWYSKFGSGIYDDEAGEITRILGYGNDDKPDMSLLPKKLIKRIQTRVYYEYQDYSNKFFEKNYGDAVTLLKHLVEKDLHISDDYKRVDAIITGIKVLDESTLTKRNVKKMKMLASSHTQYSFIDEDRSKLKNIDCCVLDNFLATYPHVSKENFIEYAGEGGDEKTGFTSEQIQRVCKKYDISHYAFDINKRCFEKNVSSHRNYKALVYYCIDHHMYLISNKLVIKSLVETAKDIKIRSVCFEEYEKKNIFESDLPVYEDIEDITTIKESCIIIYNKNNLNKELLASLENNFVPDIKKCQKSNVLEMQIVNNDIIINMFSDPNDLSQLLNHKLVKELCIKHNLSFSNQTYPSLIKELREIHINTGRIFYTQEERLAFMTKSPYCNNPECKILLTMEKKKKGTFNIDHIEPYSQSQNNDESNLQLLCVECHMDKTQEEKLNGEHIKISKTHSSFNEETGKIFNSALCQSLAFVEIINWEDIESLKKELEDIMASAKPRFEIWCDNYYLNNPPNYIIDKISGSVKYINSDTNFWHYIQHNDISKDVIIEINNKLKKYHKENPNPQHNLDCNGCRRNIVLNNKFDYPLFTVMDSKQIYHGQTSPGIYYIESDNYMPMRGNGWYSYPMVAYCLRKKIIISSNIKYCVLSSLVTKHDYYNSFIEWCSTNLSIDHYKLAINAMIGGLAVNKDNAFWKSLFYTKDKDEAYSNYLLNEGSFINIKQTKDSVFYQVFAESISLNIETEKPIYNQILDLEAIEMHRLKCIIEKKGGEILEYKTDAIRYSIKEFPFQLIDDKNILGYYWDEAKKSPKYKIEIKDNLKIELKPRYKRTEKFEFIEKEFTVYPDVIDDDFTPLVNLTLELKNVFITGIAGAGKSTLVEEIKKELDIKNISYTVLATTNLAALNVGGMTIDMYCNKLKSKKNIDEKVTEYIIVDEISMMKEYFYKMLHTIKMFKPDTKFILCGHFEQFEVVNDRVGQQNDSYYSDSGIFHELVSSNIIHLSKCRRSDDKHFKNCQNYRNIKVSDYANSEDTNLHICYTNVKRCELNKICMDKHEKRVKAENDAHKKHGHSKIRYSLAKNLDKNPYSKISQDVFLFEDCPIISITNKKDLKIVNGERFEISDITEEFIEAKNRLKTKTIEIPMNLFQKYFHVAFAITCHKSQGQTIKQPYTIHEWDTMSRKAKYVSLSRGAKYEDVNLV